MCLWIKALIKEGAVIQDSQEGFEEELSGPVFTLVPLGGSGVGKSTLSNLLSGAMAIDEQGGLYGYEDQMFAMSSGSTSMTTGRVSANSNALAPRRIVIVESHT